MSIENVRNAVGAIITQNNEVLLVHKVKMMDVVEFNNVKDKVK